MPSSNQASQYRKPVGEWASLFPKSPFPLVEKSKVERFCEVCLNSSDTPKILAKKFCVVCEEFMCDNCAVCHRNMKMSKCHQIITTEELENNPENRIRFKEGFGCPAHNEEDVKFYCKSHEIAFCGTCLFHHHKACQNVIELKESLPGLVKEMNPHKIMEQMRKLEDQLRNFMEVNEENIGVLEARINNISAEIGEIRKKINAVLDDMEVAVKLEGNRIYKEWLIRKQEQNHQCQSMVSAIRNSQALLETVDQFGSDTQKFLVTTKMMKQLQCYIDQIREKFERVDSINIRLEFDNNIKAILSQDASGLVKIKCQEAKILQSTGLTVPLEQRTVELLRVIDVHCPSNKNPANLGIVQLPEGYIVMSDSTNRTCCLYDSSYNFVASHKLPENPYGICLIGVNEIAVTMPIKKLVQFLLVKDRSIRETGTVTTMFTCFGIETVNTEEIIVSGYCAVKSCTKKYNWSLVSKNGNVKLHHGCSRPEVGQAYVALNTSKSRVYLSVSETNGLYCFGLTDEKQYFVYSSKDLQSPRGVAVDRDDNVYVVGFSSNNIHKLSPNGLILQVITYGVPERPQGISFNHNRDQFVIISEGQMSMKLHYFVHK